MRWLEWGQGGWRELKPTIADAQHTNTSLGYKNDSICRKLHAIYFPSRDATDELRTLDLKQKDLKGIKMSISL